MRFAEPMEAPEEPPDLEELGRPRGCGIERLSGRPQVAGGSRRGAVAGEHRDEPSASRTARSRHREPRLEQQVEERCLEGEGERGSGAEEEEATVRCSDAEGRRGGNGRRKLVDPLGRGGKIEFEQRVGQERRRCRQGRHHLRA